MPVGVLGGALQGAPVAGQAEQIGRLGDRHGRLQWFERRQLGKAGEGSHGCKAYRRPTITNGVMGKPIAVSLASRFMVATRG